LLSSACSDSAEAYAAFLPVDCQVVAALDGSRQPSARALIGTMVEGIRPEPGRTIADPARDTGGFPLGARDFLNDPEHCRLDRRRAEPKRAADPA
jgi:hypothetical protein